MPKARRRRKQERKTIEAMIALYCRRQHASGGDLCPECAALADYARQRLEKCPFGDQKPTCATCPIHCYKPACRAQVREVMRYAGPRLLLRRPVLTIRHLLVERTAAPKLRRRRKDGGS
jgi:Nitrous oxide-stimulated promoter